MKLLAEKRESTLCLLSEDVPAAMREAYNRIRVNLIARADIRHGEKDALCPVLGVASAVCRAGSPYLAANLAISFAQLGLSTLLVDADFRSESDLAALLGSTAEAGLADCIADPAAKPVCTEIIPHLSLLARGKAEANPADLLGYAAFGTTLSALRAEYDVILVLLPAVTAYADAATAAPALSGVVLGTVPGADKRHEVAAAIEALQGARAALCGMIACEE